MSERLDIYSSPGILINIESEFEIIIEKMPRHTDEIRELIIKAWLKGYLTEAACRRLIGKLNNEL